MEPLFLCTTQSSSETCKTDSPIQLYDNTVGANYDRDRVKLLKVFPVEIWTIILSWANTLGELKNVCNTAGYLRTLLLDKRTEFLFQSVFTFLEPHFDPIRTGYNAVYRSTCSRFSSVQIQPNASKSEKWFSSILRCRLVSKAWCAGIDSFYESENAFETPAKANTNDWASDRYNPTGVMQFMEHFQATHSNKRSPFLARRVRVNFTESSSDLEHLYNFVEKYGKHIWYCTIQAFDTLSGSRICCYASIRYILQSMPNLKALDIAYKRLYYLYDKEMLSHLQDFQTYIRVDGGLPMLKNLTTLRTETLLTPIFHQLVQTNSHIAKLEVNGESDVVCDKPYEIENMTFPNLRHLSLKVGLKERNTFRHDLKKLWNLETFEFELKRN